MPQHKLPERHRSALQRNLLVYVTLEKGGQGIVIHPGKGWGHGEESNKQSEADDDLIGGHILRRHCGAYK